MLGLSKALFGSQSSIISILQEESSPKQILVKSWKVYSTQFPLALNCNWWRQEVQTCVVTLESLLNSQLSQGSEQPSSTLQLKVSPSPSPVLL